MGMSLFHLLYEDEEGDVTDEMMGTFTEQEWSEGFPKWLEEKCCVASHEISKGVLQCIFMSIKFKLRSGRRDFKEELRALNNKYFADAISDIDEDINVDFDDNLNLMLFPSGKFMKSLEPIKIDGCYKLNKNVE